MNALRPLLTRALIGLCLMPFALSALGAQPSAAPVSAAPQRVVSINLCTDQLAMLLAAPGQLVSVTALARDPRSSAMTQEAAAYPVNFARAEEIYLLGPDLVLAGTYSDPATLSMLERLGIPVARFDPAFGLDAVAAGMRQMGEALGRQEEAEAMARAFEQRLAQLAHPRPTGPLAAIYAANGYTTGAASLSGEIVMAAGLRNLAQERGLEGGGTLPLELLVLAAPELLIGGDIYPGASRSEEILQHPALARMAARRIHVADRDWLCGLPRVLDVVAALQAAGQDAAP